GPYRNDGPSGGLAVALWTVTAVLPATATLVNRTSKSLAPTTVTSLPVGVATPSGVPIPGGSGRQKAFVQLVPACVTVKSWLPIEIRPVRAAVPGLAATVYDTVPLPAPLGGDTESQESGVLTGHVHAAAVTPIVLAVPPTGAVADAGDSDTRQPLNSYAPMSIAAP